MSDDIPDAVEQRPWRTSDGPRPTVHVYPHRRPPTLQVRIGGAWRRGDVIGRQDWADGAVIYQISVLVDVGTTITRTYRWPQPGLRVAEAGPGEMLTPRE